MHQCQLARGERTGKRMVLDMGTPMDAILDKLERAKVEHPFRVIKRQFEQVEGRYRGQVKITE